MLYGRSEVSFRRWIWFAAVIVILLYGTLHVHLDSGRRCPVCAQFVALVGTVLLLGRLLMRQGLLRFVDVSVRFSPWIALHPSRGPPV